MTMPPAPTGTLSQQVQKQYAYLFQLAQMLNRAAEQAEQQPQTQTVQKPVQAAQAQTVVELKSLIVKSADAVRKEMDRLETELKGSYVAVSDFGTYLERISQEIEADPTGLSRYFKFASDIQPDVEQAGTDFSAYKTDVQGYIRQGIVGYNGTVPILGIAIGQDIRTTGTSVETEQGVFDDSDKRSTLSVWTTEKLSFYIGGQEAAYFSNGKLTVAQIATDRIAGAGKWDVSFTNGVKFKWIGWRRDGGNDYKNKHGIRLILLGEMGERRAGRFCQQDRHQLVLRRDAGT